MSIDLVVILGPTATGKTRIGVHLAQGFGGEIISADSRQVYRGMDLGTGKDLAEYGAIPVHLIDIADPEEDFDVFVFQRRCYAAIDQIRQRGKLPIVVGGTGLYLDALLKGYRMVEAPTNEPLRRELEALDSKALSERLLALRPGQHNTTDLVERQRLVRAIEIAEAEAAAPEQPDPPNITPAIFGVHFDPAALRSRITARLRQRLEEGMIEEVQALREGGVAQERLDYFGLEYRFIARHVAGEIDRNDMFQKLNAAIHQFAKRQRTWFRRMERQGVAIQWVDGEGTPEQLITDKLRALLNG